MLNNEILYFFERPFQTAVELIGQKRVSWKKINKKTLKGFFFLMYWWMHCCLVLYHSMWLCCATWWRQNQRQNVICDILALATYRRKIQFWDPHLSTYIYKLHCHVLPEASITKYSNVKTKQSNDNKNSSIYLPQVAWF